MTDIEWKKTFTNIWDAYHASISAYIHYRIPHDYYSAEDCIQNVFLTFYHSKDKIDDLKHIKAWLYRVSDNIIKKEYFNKLRCLPVDSIENNLPCEDIHKKIEEHNLREIIFNNLNESEKRHYMLFYEKDLCMKDIAEKLKISVNAAKKRKERLKIKIMNIYKEMYL